MTDFVILYIKYFADLFNLYNIISFSFNGYQIQLGDLIIGMIIFLMIIAVFWKGARG